MNHPRIGVGRPLVIASGITLALGFAVFAGAGGCEEKGPLEKAGQKVDKAADKTGDAVKKAGDKIKDAAGK